jgi:hypothetical protein
MHPIGWGCPGSWRGGRPHVGLRRHEQQQACELRRYLHSERCARIPRVSEKRGFFDNFFKKNWVYAFLLWHKRPNSQNLWPT